MARSRKFIAPPGMAAPGPERPKYVLEWMNQRVEYPRPLGSTRPMLLRGRVSDVKRVRDDGEFVTLLNVAADDGFLDAGVDAYQARRLSEEET
jgi:hypothetical protein